MTTITAITTTIITIKIITMVILTPTRIPTIKARRKCRFRKK